MRSRKKKPSANFPCPAESDCQGTLRVKTIDYHFRYQGRDITVPEVEVWVCDQCGEQVFPYGSARKTDTYKKYSGRLNLRVDPEIHAELAQRAKAHHHSVNQEAHSNLRSSFEAVLSTEKEISR